MLTVATDRHRLHHPKNSVNDGGRLVPPVEIPARADRILAAVTDARLGELVPPAPFGRDPIARVHTEAYLDFLEHAHGRWRAATGADDDAEAVPTARAIRGQDVHVPEHIDGALGWFSHDADPVLAGTWDAASAAADVALTAARAVHNGASGAYAVCRPPGHHAAADSFAGYCYLNNAAIVAQWCCDRGARVAILDVDFHHGNGTQQLFYDRADVLFVSLHADPRDDYPYFLGHATETGRGAGVGANRNYPLPAGTDWTAYEPALTDAATVVRDHAPDILVVSLGVDTAIEDADSFRLTGDDFSRMGSAIAALGCPTVFVQEGGYCLDVIGRNVVNVLRAFEG
ncbi:MAG TPA: histone deacetylase family protein [Acidimicrobiia bacterium]|nr:histone deacetylase family protein [Acidimicrobiia bacterium]